MSEHTKTPYQISQIDFQGNKHPHNWYLTGQHTEEELEDCSSCVGIAVVLGNATAGQIPQKNAEFIVRAVNSHDALVAALKAMILNRELGECESQKRGLPRMIEVREMAEAALKLAGEPT